MSKKQKIKKSPPKETKPNFLENHWEKIVIILLLALPLIYFAPFLNSNRMIAGSDYLIGGYPFEKWTAEQDGLPLWYSHVFGGIPVLGAPVGGPLAPLNVLKAIMQPHVALAVSFIIFFFLAGFGMYLYLKEIGLSPYSAAVGAIIYQFIGNLATAPNAGHGGRAASIATFPLMLFFVHCALRSRKLIYFILTALTTAFAFYEGHFQMTYYGLLFIIGYVIYYLITHRKESSRKELVKVFIYGLSTVVLICLLMAAVWLPVIGGLETAARGVERGYGYATSWSLPPLELIDLAIPTYSGILQNYWGFNPFKIHLEYFGLTPLIFAIFALILYWKKPYVKFYAFAIIIIILVALGGYTPFFRIFYTIVPGFRLFRAPALVFFLISFGFIVLGSIGFENIFIKKYEGRKEQISKKKFYIIAGILLAIFVLTGLVCAAGKDSIIQSMQESFRSGLNPRKLSTLQSNFPQFIQGIWRSLLFCAAVLIMIFVSLKRKFKTFIFALAAITITLIDQLPLMVKFRPQAPGPKTYYAANNLVRFIKKDKNVFRVFPTPWYEHTTDSYLLYHNIQSAGGYIPNPIQRYQEFIGAGTSVMFNPQNLLQYPKFLDMLNIKYVLAPNLPEDISRYDMQTQKTIEIIRTYLARFNRVFVGREYSVYLNGHTLPRAYVVPYYQVLKEPEVLDFLKSPQFDPRQTVILEENPRVPNPEGEFILVSAQITEYSANRVICTTECSYPGFLVLADNWHPDWQVYVDGKTSQLYRANYTFRAVYLAPGKHIVVFLYKSPFFSLGKIVTIFVFVLSIAFCIVILIPIPPLKKQKISV